MLYLWEILKYFIDNPSSKISFKYRNSTTILTRKGLFFGGNTEISDFMLKDMIENDSWQETFR